MELTSFELIGNWIALSVLVGVRPLTRLLTALAAGPAFDASDTHGVPVAPSRWALTKVVAPIRLNSVAWDSTVALMLVSFWLVLSAPVEPSDTPLTSIAMVNE